MPSRRYNRRMPPSPPSDSRIRPEPSSSACRAASIRRSPRLLLQEAGPRGRRGCSCPIGRTTTTPTAPPPSDLQDARRVCDTLNIPLHRASFAGEYRERVFAHFLREYAAGRTPNPDVLCNREIKFGVCLDYMHRLGAAKIATGHYARLRAPTRAAPRGCLKAADRCQGSELFPARRRTGGARRHPVSARRAAQGRGAPARRTRPACA